MQTGEINTGNYRPGEPLKAIDPRNGRVVIMNPKRELLWEHKGCSQEA